MNILIAPDKFKDACSAQEVCKYLAKGIQKVLPNTNCVFIPLADGGEGTLESIASVWESEWKTINTFDALQRVIEATYLFIPSKKTAIIEMARATGIELLKQEERNCMITSSYGTGIQIKDAISSGADEIILTVGGTATNDGAIGIAAALGFEFYDDNNNKLPPIGKNLLLISRIDDTNVAFDINKVKFTIATDVVNPFYGENGAAMVYGKQKGGSSEDLKNLDLGLKNFANILEKYSGKNPQNIAGSGAGGGAGGGLYCLLNANIVSAADWILEINQIQKVLHETDVLITGEGKVDSQTWQGKLISKLLKLSKQANVPVIIICGTLEDVEMVAKQENILLATSILTKPMTLQEALLDTPNLLEKQGILLSTTLKNIIK